jgi:glycine cleavage system H protein
MKEYTESKEWVETDNGVVTIGLTRELIEEIGDVVAIDFPEIEKEVKKGDTLVNIESAKAVNNIYSPVSGKVLEINEKLSSDPESLNDASEEEAWLVKIKL